MPLLLLYILVATLYECLSDLGRVTAKNPTKHPSTDSANRASAMLQPVVSLCLHHTAIKRKHKRKGSRSWWWPAANDVKVESKHAGAKVYIYICMRADWLRHAPVQQHPHGSGDDVHSAAISSSETESRHSPNVTSHRPKSRSNNNFHTHNMCNYTVMRPTCLFPISTSSYGELSRDICLLRNRLLYLFPFFFLWVCSISGYPTGQWFNCVDLYSSLIDAYSKLFLNFLNRLRFRRFRR